MLFQYAFNVEKKYKEIDNFKQTCKWHPGLLDERTETRYLCCGTKYNSLKIGCTDSFHRRGNIDPYELNDMPDRIPLLIFQSNPKKFDKRFIVNTHVDKYDPVLSYIEFARLL